MQRREVRKKSDIESRVLDLARVTRVSAGGRRLRFRAVVAVGDRKGRIGLGIAKSLSVRDATGKAQRLAEKRMIKVALQDNTILNPVVGKAGASRVLLKPRQKKGLVAGATVRILCQLAGIEAISSKILSRSKNSFNIAQATINAFQELNEYAIKSDKIKASSSK